MKPWERVAAAYVCERVRPDLDQVARWFDASLEEAWTAIYCLATRPEFDAASWRLVERWSRAPDTWAIADPMARILVAGHLEAGVIDADLLHTWAAREQPFWYRRIALVATTSLNGGLGGPTAKDAQVSGHVVIAGYGVAGQLLARTLAQAEVPYVVLEVDADRVREGQREHAHVYYGDVTSHEALEHARLGHARVLVMLVNDRVAMRRGIRLARADCPDVLILARTRYLSDRDDLVALGADHVVCEEVEGGTEMTARVLKSLGLATPAIYDEINSALGSESDEFLAGAMDDWTDPAEQKP